MKDGGPAFPIKYTDIKGKVEVEYIHTGITKRDYFAATASDEDIAEIMHGLRDICKITRQQARYVHADAMLAELEKK